MTAQSIIVPKEFLDRLACHLESVETLLASQELAARIGDENSETDQELRLKCLALAVTAGTPDQAQSFYNFVKAKSDAPEARDAI